MFTLSAFADEISPDPRAQVAVLKACNVRYIEFRSIHGTNVLALTDAQIQELKQLLALDVSGRSDVFAVGVTLYELLALEPLFYEDATELLIDEVTWRPLPSVRELVPDIPRSIEDILTSSLDRDPSRRPTAAAMGRALYKWFESQAVVAPPDGSGTHPASEPRVNETGPLAVPPEDGNSFDERTRDRLMPEPEPPLKIIPSSLYQSRIDSILSSTARMKQLCTRKLPDRYSPLSVWMS